MPYLCQAHVKCSYLGGRFRVKQRGKYYQPEKVTPVPVSRSFLHHPLQFVNHGPGRAGDLFLPNTGCANFRLRITIQTIEEIDSEER
jgi:hypothetical protein